MNTKIMFELDHVAIQTEDVAASVEFYTQNFAAEILYADATWAFLKVGQGKIALVTPSQHPPHVALRVDASTLQAEAARAGKPIDRHRDGTTGIYVNDPNGTVLELICYPDGETVYEKNSVGYMNLQVQIERENDGRWIAEVPDLPGVLAYGATRMRAIANAEALALRVIAERLENEENIPDMTNLFLVAA